jgi:hypothetical protein
VAAAQLVAVVEQGMAVGLGGEVGSCAGPFIGAVRRWLGRAEHAELTRPSMAVREKSWRGLGRRDSRRATGGAIGRDLSGRAWWRRAGRREVTRGGRRRPAVVVAQR